MNFKNQLFKIGILLTCLICPVVVMSQANTENLSLHAFSKDALVNQNAEQGQLSQSATPEKLPSKGTAFFLSFLLPGSGEYYAGSTKMAKIFLGTEVALWSAFGTLRYYGSRLEHDYQLYAKAHAGVSISGKDKDYFVDVENFESIEAYNQYQLQQRNLNDVYPETDEYSWQWDSESNRKKFGNMRIKSDSAYRHSLFMIGGVVINHIISSIDAVRIVHKKQKSQANKTMIGIAPLPGGAQVSVVQLF